MKKRERCECYANHTQSICECKCHPINQPGTAIYGAYWWARVNAIRGHTTDGSEP